MAANEPEDLPVPTSDAAEASAQIEAWLKDRASQKLDWHGVLAQIKSALDALTKSKVVLSDSLACAIIVRMMSAQNMEDFAADVDALGDRIAELTGVNVGQRWRAPVVNIASFEQQSTAKPAKDKPANQDAAPLPRMVLRL